MLQKGLGCGLCLGLVITLTACAVRPKPELLSPDFETIRNSNISLLPSVDQRSEAERADQPTAFGGFNAIVNSQDFREKILPEAFAKSRAITFIPAPNESIYVQRLASTDTSPDRALFLQLYLKHYHYTTGISYRATCGGDLRSVQNHRQTVLWHHEIETGQNYAGSPLSSGLLGFALIAAVAAATITDESNMQDCLTKMLKAVPEPSKI